MAEVQPAGVPADNEGGNAGGGNDSQFSFGKMMQMVSRAILTYYAIQMVTSTLGIKPSNKGHSTTPSGVPETLSQQRAPPGLVRDNMFSKGELLDMWLYSSTGPTFIEDDPDLKLLWHEKDIRLCDEDPRRLSLQYPLTPVLKNNGTAHLHVFFARSGMKHLPSDTGYVPEAVFSSSHPLVKYVRLPKAKNRGSNLLAGSTSSGINEGQNDTAAAVPDEEGAGDASGEEEQLQQLAGEIVAHWKPNITIALVQDFTSYPDAQIPPQIREHLVIDPYSGNYYPPVFFNDFWLLKEHLIPLNSTIDVVDLHLELTYTHVFMWQILIGTELNFAAQREFGAMGENEADQIKRIFIEGNPYFLALTMVVSLFHTVFDMLAFKSDIGFWRNNKSMEGLSARSIIIQAFCQIVIFLYLLDNDTSYVVLFSNGMGLVIQFWKITKVMDVTVVSWNGLPTLRFEDRASYSQNKTKQYDAEATKYLSYVLFPLVLIYSIYALIYQTHKSWYSWVVNSLVGAVYMFGFILMCPQLYLNYKLKSVAHMPWRQMTYKFLNTIIDDLFAFVIKMPLLHRLSVFRDDLIFVIFLYQRWIYRVDMTRTNEFGFSAEDPDEADKPAIEGGDGAAATVAPEEKEEMEQDGATQASGALTRRRGKSNKKAKAAAAAEDSTAPPGTTNKKDT